MKKIVCFIIVSMFLTWNVSADILTVTNTADSGTGSLRRIIEIANNGDSIIFDKSLAGDTIELQSDIPNFNSISISGKNASVVIYGAKISRGKIIDNLTFDNSGIQKSPNDYSQIPMLISDCTFKNSLNSAISYSEYPVYITNCTFENNTASNGGAISITLGSFSVTNCTFKNNTATSGGAISCYVDNYGSCSVTNCIFENNTATSGGAIYTNSYILPITDCKFENNTATNGGAIFSFPSQNYSTSTTSVTNCTFDYNIAEDSGGAIASSSPLSYFTSTVLSVINCAFKNNSANGSGGAISSPGTSTSSVTNSTFDNNNATDGGAISSFSFYSTSSVTNSTFNNNNATEYGGAIYGGYGFSTNCTYSNNLANNGGAIYAISPDAISLTGNIFVNNKIMPDNILNDVKSCKSLGYNVYASNQSTVFSEPTDYRYIDTLSLLLPLGDYGGDTPTMLINTSVPDWETIVRRVPVSSDRTTDQRGFSLPITGLACAGSVEMLSGVDYSGINEVKMGSVNVYPNPASDVIHFILNDNSEALLYDASGKLVKEQSGKTGSNEININDLSQGIYFLNVDGKTTKIIKK